MTSISLTIRSAIPTDASTLADLMTELGYPSTQQEMLSRLKELLADEIYEVLVAVSNDEVTGTVSMHLGKYVEKNGRYCRITSLVVMPRFRNKGIGHALVAECEKWAKTSGARCIIVNSSSSRTATHEFYERLNFEQTGLRFVKEIE